MKKLSLLSGLLALTMHVGAQTAPIPEFKNKVMFVEADDNLSELEKTDLSTSLKIGMVGNANLKIVAKGKEAAVKHAGTTSENYIVKIEQDMDPEVAVELFKFEKSKKGRSFLVAAMAMSKDKAIDLPKAKLTFKKVIDGVYMISTKEKLEEGEYCFMINRPQMSILTSTSSRALIGYCFHISGN